MSDTARQISQEYWRPAQATRQEFTLASAETCAVCGTQFAPGARFCHVCGDSREPELRPSSNFGSRMAEALDFTTLRQRLGLSATSLVLVFIAAICALAAVITGLIYGASTLVEWQAVQTWRIEWLIASIAALVAAILFKNSNGAKTE